MSVSQTYTSDGPVSASTSTPINYTFDGPATISSSVEQIPAARDPLADEPISITEEELKIRVQERTSHLINGITIPSLRMLLTQVLTVIDVAIPNKDQNRAVKRTVREDFDTAYFGILGRAYPECNWQTAEGRFALDPAPVKEGNSPLS